ncbi:MAG: Elongation factor P [Chlamydiae bacterium]|nr:Elongation factor P [Chlamydiota bacterium]
MAQMGTSDLRGGMKVELDREPYTVISNEFVKPGKGQSFNRIKLKNLKTGRVVEKTFKSGDKLDIADVEESKMRMLYKEPDGIVFMDEQSYDQHTIPMNIIGDKEVWFMEDIEYGVVFYKGEILDVTTPTFMEMVITETAPGLRGDTSGRILKPATTETGAKIQIPIFIEEGEKVKVDTRTGEYVSRV